MTHRLRAGICRAVRIVTCQLQAVGQLRLVFGFRFVVIPVRQGQGQPFAEGQRHACLAAFDLVACIPVPAEGTVGDHRIVECVERVGVFQVAAVQRLFLDAFIRLLAGCPQVMVGTKAAAGGQIFKADADPRMLAAEFMVVEDIAAIDRFFAV